MSRSETPGTETDVLTSDGFVVNTWSSIFFSRFGDEWVPELWSAQIWQKARNDSERFGLPFNFYQWDIAQTAKKLVSVKNDRNGAFGHRQ